jgi:hypothetical protein
MDSVDGGDPGFGLQASPTGDSASRGPQHEVSATDRVLLAIDWANRPSSEVGPLIEDMLATELS